MWRNIPACWKCHLPVFVMTNNPAKKMFFFFTADWLSNQFEKTQISKRDGRNTKSSRVNLPSTPLHSFPMTLEIHLVFFWKMTLGSLTPGLKKVGTQPREGEKQTRQVSAFPRMKNKRGWEPRGRNRWRGADMWGMTRCLASDWCPQAHRLREELFCCPSTRRQLNFLWSCSFLCGRVAWASCCGHEGVLKLSSL